MKPLDGIVVLDFSRVLAGPLATMILGELGATVVKIERPRTGDESRLWEPKAGSESAYFMAFNRAKRSATLDLKSENGRAAGLALAARADVLVENFLPGEMDRFGLGWPALSALNPRLIYVSSTGFGQTGPYRDRKGYDTVFQALSGIMALTGYPDGPPAKAGVPIADMSAGLWIAIAALSGVIGRQTSGKGCRVDLGMLDVQIGLLAVAAARLFALGEETGRSGTEHPGRVPSAAFQCRDGGWMHISGSDQDWPNLCRVLGLDELAADPALARNLGRVAARERVMAALRTAIAARDRAEVAEALRAVGVPAGEVNGLKEILEDPHIAARGVVGHFDHPNAGRFPALGNPLKFEGWDDPGIAPPPVLGADTRAVLAEIAGLGEDEIDRLTEEKAT